MKNKHLPTLSDLVKAYENNTLDKECKAFIFQHGDGQGYTTYNEIEQMIKFNKDREEKINKAIWGIK